jgi:hypothetical protein
MDVLPILTMLCTRGYLMRVRWDRVAMMYLVELIDGNDTVNVLRSRYIVNDEQLLPWLVQLLDNEGPPTDSLDA